jgi:hypothetical protein
MSEKTENPNKNFIKYSGVCFASIEKYQKSIENIIEIALAKFGDAKHFLSQNEAFERYGKANVTFWIKSGLVKKHKDGEKTCTIRLSRLELETASITNNRAEWFMKNRNNFNHD